MPAILVSIFSWAMAGAIPFMLVSTGITLVTAVGFSAAVTTLLDQAASAIGGMPEVALQLALLSGVGEALSIIGGAIVTRVSLKSASNFIGLNIAKGG